MERQYKLDYAIISKKIKNARKNANLTQAVLAESIGISTNAVAKLESNLMNASLQTLINIANILHTDINYFLADEAADNAKQTNVDTFLHSLISKLPQKDKEFIIHTINGLKAYHTDGN